MGQLSFSSLKLRLRVPRPFVPRKLNLIILPFAIRLQKKNHLTDPVGRSFGPLERPALWNAA